MSVMQKLMEFNDELVRVRAELDALRREQSKVQRICVDGVRRITEVMDELDATRKQLQNVLFEQEDISSVESQPDFGVERMPKLMEINDELVRVREERDRLRSERDQAVENAVRMQVEAVRLQAQLAEAKAMLTGVTQGREHAEANRRRADTIITELQAELDATRKQLQDVCSVKSAGQSNLVRDVSHYIEAAEVDRPTEPEFKPYTFEAYIVGDKSQPDALRIVWATEEWVKHAEFSIVHRISDLQFSGNDTFTPDQFSVNLKIQ